MNIAMLAAGINAAGAAQGAAQFNAAVDSMAERADSALGKVRASIARISSNLFNLRGLLATLGVGEAVREFMDASRTFDRITNTLRAATGSAAAASVEYEWLRQQVTRLALDLPTTAQQFAQMAAAAKGTALEGDSLKKVFLGVATATSALGVDAQHTEYALYAVQQMISKGVITMEELRRQLGDNLPGAFQIAAEAAGMNTREFTKAIKAGQIISAEFLPKFADLLQNRYAAAAERAAGMTQGLTNKLKTAAYEFRVFVAHSGLGEAFNDALRKLADLLRSDDLKQAAQTLGTVLGKAVTLAAEAFIFLGKHAQATLLVLGAYGTLKIGMFFSDLYVQLVRIKNALLEIQAVQSGLGWLNGLTQAAPAIGIATAKMGIVPQQYAGLFTQRGTLLNKSQYAMKAAAGGISSSEAIGYEALSFLTGKGGAVLPQTALNARLAGQAFKDMSSAAKVATAEMAAMYGLQVQISSGTRFLAFWQRMGSSILGAANSVKTYAVNIAGAVANWLVFAAQNPAQALYNIGAAALGAGRALMAAAFSNPWTALAAVLLTVITTLYLLRNETLTIGGHTAKIGSYIGVVWDKVKVFFGVLWDGLKAIGSFFKNTFVGIMEWILGHALWQKMENFFSKFNIMRQWAEAAENREKAQASTADPSKARSPLGFPSIGPWAPGTKEFYMTSTLANAGKTNKDTLGQEGLNDSKKKRDSVKEYLATLNAEIESYVDIASSYGKARQELIKLNAEREVEKKFIDFGNKATAAEKTQAVQLAIQRAIVKDKADAVEKANDLRLATEAENNYLKQQTDILNKVTLGTNGYRQSIEDLQANLYALEKTKEYVGRLNEDDYKNLFNEQVQHYKAAAAVKAHQSAIEQYGETMDNLRQQLADKRAEGVAILDEAQNAALTRRMGYLKLDEMGPTLQAKANTWADNQMKAIRAAFAKAGKEMPSDMKDTLVDIFKTDEVNKHNQALAEWAAQVRSSVGSLREFTDNAKRMEEALGKDMLTVEEYNRAMRDLRRAWDEAVDAELLKSTNWQDGFTAAMREIQRSSRDTAKNFHDAFANSFGKLQEQLVTFLDTGKFKFSDFVNAVRHEINTILVKNLTGNMMDFLLGNKGNTYGANGKEKGPGFFGKILGVGGSNVPTGTLRDPFAVMVVNNGMIGALNSVTATAKIREASGETAEAIGKLGKDAKETSGAFSASTSMLGRAFQQFGFLAFSGSGGGGWTSVLMAGLQGFLGTLFMSGGYARPDVTDIPISENPTLSYPFAYGGVMTKNGPLRLKRYSKGGIAYGRQLAEYGEGDTPEAYVPLPDGRRIPVNMQGGTGTVIQAETRIYNQTGQAVQARTESHFDGRRWFQDIWITELNEEGPAAKALRKYIGV